MSKGRCSGIAVVSVLVGLSLCLWALPAPAEEGGRIIPSGEGGIIVCGPLPDQPDPHRVGQIVIPLSEWLQWAFSVVGGREEVLRKEMESAKTAYPTAALSYELLGVYATYLEQGGHPLPASSPRGGRTVMKPDPGEIPTWLDEWCRIIQLIEEGQLPPEGGGVTPGRRGEEQPQRTIEVTGTVTVVNPFRTCDKIRADYDEAGACLDRYRSHPPANEAESAELTLCMDNREKYKEELIERRCRTCEEARTDYDRAFARYLEAEGEEKARAREDVLKYEAELRDLGCSF